MTTAQSKANYQESQTFLAGGVASSLRAAMKPVPLFVESASGATIKDVDGNEYIDYLLAYGPLILGHSHPVLTEKIQQQMKKGYTYGLQHKGEIELAKRLTELLPCADKVSLSGSGTEAVMLAIRLAKEYTGKTKVVRFHGHYHGWSDTIFTSFPSPDMLQGGDNHPSEQVLPGTGGQSKKALEEVILIPWNDFEALEETLKKHKDEIAAVISEPVMCNSGCIHPKPGYLEKIRELTKLHGIVMILDEVITGFRLGISGAHGRFGIQPDIVTIGKALGGGIAISAVGGHHQIMSLVEHGKVGHLGTLNGNGVSTAAALTVIEELSKNSGAAYHRMEKITKQLVDGIRELFAKHQIHGLINHIGPVFHMMFTEEKEVNDFDAFQKRDAAKYTRFAELLLDGGVLVRPSGLWYVSTAHENKHVDHTLAAIDEAFRKM